MIDYNVSLNGISILLCILIFCYALILRRQINRQSGTLNDQSEYFDAIQEKLHHAKTINSREFCFQNDLKQASVTTELQKPRSSYNKNRKGQRAPERYQYATTMFRSGMKKDEISDALGMSLTELSQLLTLSNLCANKKRIEKE